MAQADVGCDFLGTIYTGTFKNDYIYLEPIGKGGHGEVHKVMSKKDYQTYAVKKIRFRQHKNKDALYLIKRELINNAKLSHDNVVRYYDSWVELRTKQNSSSSRYLSESCTDCYIRKKNFETDLADNIKDSTESDREIIEETGVIYEPITTNVTLQKISTSTHESLCLENNKESKYQTNLEYLGHFCCPSVTERETESMSIAELDLDLTGPEINESCFQTSLPTSFNSSLIDFELLRTSPEVAVVTSVVNCTEKYNKGEKSDIIFRDLSSGNDFELGNIASNDITYSEFEEKNDTLIDFQSEIEIEEIIKQINKSMPAEQITYVYDVNSKQKCRENNEPKILELYIKMEFCELTLREAIDKGKFINNDDFGWNFFRQIVRGLAYIHSKGIIHRDLNPNNIFITMENVVKIGDFGLSRLRPELESGLDNIAANSPENHSHGGRGMTGGRGTIWYTAPEALKETICSYGHEVDLFSLGLVFFEMCYYPFRTAQEKAQSFKRLRNERLFPDDFDVASKEKQTKVIRALLDPNPKRRVSLATLMSPSDGFIAPEPSEELQFEAKLAYVISKPEGELYHTMIQQLFKQRTGRCFPTVHSTATPAHVRNLCLSFAKVAESHGARDIDLPLFMPLNNSTSNVEHEPVAFLDSQGNPVMLSDSSLRAFDYMFERNNVPYNNTFYTTQSAYKFQMDSTQTIPDNKPEISFFSISAKDDMFAIGKALLIFQQTLIRTNHCLDDFVISLTHQELENCLFEMFDLGETEQRVLYKLYELVGDATRRLRILKQINQTGMTIPEILMISGSVQKSSRKLKNVLAGLRRPVNYTNTSIKERIDNALNFVVRLKELLDTVGVSIDTKLELFMNNPQVGLIDSGIKFRLRTKPEANIIVRGGQYDMVRHVVTDIDKTELLWYEVNALELQHYSIPPNTPEVIIIYDKTVYDEVKHTAYLCGKLSSIGLNVSEIEQNKGAKNTGLSVCCKFLITFETLLSAFENDGDTKLKRIPVSTHTVVNHIKQRRNVHCRRYLLNYRIYYYKSRISKISIFRMRRSQNNAVS